MRIALLLGVIAASVVLIVIIGLNDGSRDWLPIYSYPERRLAEFCT
jgi:hypothetical protein